VQTGPGRIPYNAPMCLAVTQGDHRRAHFIW